jgi:hypothetical protein
MLDLGLWEWASHLTRCMTVINYKHDHDQLHG